MGLTRRSPTVAIRFFGVMVVTLAAIALLLAMFAGGLYKFESGIEPTTTPVQQR